MESGLSPCRIPWAAMWRFGGGVLSLWVFLCLLAEAKSPALPSVRVGLPGSRVVCLPQWVPLGGSSLADTQRWGRGKFFLAVDLVSEWGRNEGSKGSSLANIVVMMGRQDSPLDAKVSGYKLEGTQGLHRLCKGQNSDFTSEELGRHQLYQVIKVNHQKWHMRMCWTPGQNEVGCEDENNWSVLFRKCQGHERKDWSLMTVRRLKKQLSALWDPEREKDSKWEIGEIQIGLQLTISHHDKFLVVIIWWLYTRGVKGYKRTLCPSFITLL